MAESRRGRRRRGRLPLHRQNYEGDVMNFDDGGGDRRAGGCGPSSPNDDVPSKTSTYSKEERGDRRHARCRKNGGAAAEAGRDLAALEALGKDFKRADPLMALRLPRAPVPAAASPLSSSARTRWRWASAFTASRGVGASRSPRRCHRQRSFVQSSQDLGPKRGTPVLLFVNGFGGTPALELYLMANARTSVLVLPG